MSFISCHISIEAWVSNPRDARLYYVAHRHICKLCTYYKNHTIIKTGIPFTVIFLCVACRLAHATGVALCHKKVGDPCIRYACCMVHIMSHLQWSMPARPFILYCSIKVCLPYHLYVTLAFKHACHTFHYYVTLALRYAYHTGLNTIVCAVPLTFWNLWLVGTAADL